MHSFSSYNSSSKKPVIGSTIRTSDLHNLNQNSMLTNSFQNVGQPADTIPNFAQEFIVNTPNLIQQPLQQSRLNPELIQQSIARLDSFLSYLSDKIKSNTLKISNADLVESGEQQLSQTTASRSDLSIDECNLDRFKEYMLNSHEQHMMQNQLYQEQEDNKFADLSRVTNF